MNVAPGTEFLSTLEQGESGLVGTLEWKLVDADDGTAIAASTADIIENPAGSGFYVATRTAPTVRGVYVIFWSPDGTFAPETSSTEELVVTSTIEAPAGPSGIDLCTLDDVIRFIPGYRPNDITDQKLQELITSESESIMLESGREIVPFADQPETRAFAVEWRHQQTRRVQIGDLASAGDTDIVVELQAADGTSIVTYARDEYRAQYRARRLQPRHQWEPVIALEFPSGLGGRSLTCGQTLLVTGNWGFPQIPYSIRQACAKRVVLRYITEVANTGETFSEAALENVNLAGLFASARDAVDAITDKVMIS